MGNQCCSGRICAPHNLSPIPLLVLWCSSTPLIETKVVAKEGDPKGFEYLWYCVRKIIVIGMTMFVSGMTSLEDQRKQALYPWTSLRAEKRGSKLPSSNGDILLPWFWSLPRQEESNHGTNQHSSTVTFYLRVPGSGNPAFANRHASADNLDTTNRSA